MKKKSVLITGAGGYIGRLTVEELTKRRGSLRALVALDVRATPPADRLPHVEYVTGDIRAPELADVVAKFGIDTVVHLASIVSPGKKSNREFEYSVDVGGTENVLRVCVAAKVKQIIVTSSGAAYGYYADNAASLSESDPIRGNEAFAYSRHKRLVEEMLARHRAEHPKLKQLILRPGTILGASVSNQITALFEKRAVVGLAGTETPFVFIWDRDVVACIVKGIAEDAQGIYNLAGDGTMTLRQIAARLGKPFVPLPVPLVRAALAAAKRLGLSQYGPEQVEFLRYRPVLSNRKLKDEFGYTPQLTSREVFDLYVESKKRAAANF